MLVPAAFLVVIVLASIAVDMSLVQLRTRQAVDFASGAANDAAGAAAGNVREGGGPRRVRIDPDAARALVRSELAASELAPLVVAGPFVRVSGNQVDVSLSVRADYIFAGGIPGAPDSSTVSVHATAVAQTRTDGG
jgi:hypothetical protein